MSDVNTNRDAADRSNVAGGEEDEVKYFAAKLGVSPVAVRVAIAKVGNDRAKVETELIRPK